MLRAASRISRTYYVRLTCFDVIINKVNSFFIDVDWFSRAEDLSYLAAFGNSIMAEVARLDTIAVDRAKSDFISSISHKLRSPLHGIFASVEFLQDTAVDLFQNSMIDAIERCGRTLLDTIQHVLDFAKINNLTRSKRSMKRDENSSDQRSRSSRMGVGAVY